MLKKLVAAGIGFAIGYVLGVTFGFKAAVVDYIEDDAEKLESMAEDIYPEKGTADHPIPKGFEEMIEEAADDIELDASDDGSKGFQ